MCFVQVEIVKIDMQLNNKRKQIHHRTLICQAVRLAVAQYGDVLKKLAKV